MWAKILAPVGWHQAVAGLTLPAAQHSPPHCTARSSAELHPDIVHTRDVPRTPGSVCCEPPFVVTPYPRVPQLFYSSPGPHFPGSPSPLHQCLCPMERKDGADLRQEPSPHCWPVTTDPSWVSHTCGPCEEPSSSHSCSHSNRAKQRVCRGCQGCVEIDTNDSGWVLSSTSGGAAVTHTPPPKGQCYMGLDPTFLEHPWPPLQSVRSILWHH